MADSTPNVAPLGTPTIVPISEVHPASNNPRKISSRAVEMVAKSLREFGWQQALVVDSEGVLLAGHTRLQAAKLLGLRHVPVIRAEGLTPEQARAYRVADNRTADYTSWDFPELTRELAALEGEFGDVLGLADWDAVMSSFHEINGHEPLTPDENSLTDSGFVVHVVTFTDEASAMQAAQEFYGIEGVVDVRHKR